MTFHTWQHGDVPNVQAVLFDYSGTLFRLEEDDSWFEGMEVDERQVDIVAAVDDGVRVAGVGEDRVLTGEREVDVGAGMAE